MSNQTQPKILTEAQLSICESLIPHMVQSVVIGAAVQEIIDSHRLLLSANAELSFQNMLLKSAYDKLLKENSDDNSTISNSR